jgi:hypothetical protein
MAAGKTPLKSAMLILHFNARLWCKVAAALGNYLKTAESAEFAEKLKLTYSPSRSLRARR